MPNTSEQLVAQTDELISFPEVVTQFNEAVNNGRSDAQELGLIIQKDPALTAKLLQVANSGYYGGRVEIDNVRDAIARLGIKQVRDLAFCICAKNTFDGISNKLVSPRDFWRHSLMCALAARELAKITKFYSADTLFTAGLLHDVGHLVMFSLEPELSTQALEKNIEEYDGLDSAKAERSIFGFDHAEVGRLLAKNWGLPEILQECIGSHHVINKDSSNAKVVSLVHIANSIAVLVEVESDDLDQGPEINETAWEYIGKNTELITNCIDTVKQELAEMENLLFGKLSEVA